MTNNIVPLNPPIKAAPGIIICEAYVETYAGGITISDNLKDKETVAIALEVGPDEGAVTEFGIPIKNLLGIKPGDIFFHRTYVYENYKHNGRDLKFVPTKDVTGKLC